VTTRRRLDAELVRRELTASRAEARQAIDAGRVLVNGAVAAKAAHLVAAGDAVVLTAPPARFVGRGGEKLDAALDAFGIDVTGRSYVDVGASTGGFTDCLLSRGAARVLALDVGHGQLHPRLRTDGRVVVLERTNARSATAALVEQHLGRLADGVVVDVSFISLTVVIPVLVTLCQPGADMVLLVKPQFEAGRVEVARGRGVITDPAIHERVRHDITGALVAAGCTIDGWLESPLRGAEGNRELLVHATTERSA
jgi:23S rRNA (cytidine1920-2'-O)/16S rRNA (cytidine1409-2'-O)-methyltransferase